MESAETFMVLDVDSGNSLSIFDHFEDAMSFFSLVSQGTPQADTIALVAFDKTGFALDTVFPQDLPSS
jgi:hypothetical protein